MKLSISMMMVVVCAALCIDCTPALQKDTTLAVDVAGGACTASSIVLKDPSIGSICTTVDEILKGIVSLFNVQTGSDAKPVTQEAANHALMKSILTLRKNPTK